MATAKPSEAQAVEDLIDLDSLGLGDPRGVPGWDEGNLISVAQHVVGFVERRQARGHHAAGEGSHSADPSDR